MRLPLVFSLFLMTLVTSPARELFVYVGTYTKDTSNGIYVGRLDSDTGRMSEFVLAGKTVNPSFLAIAPDGAHLYAVSENGASVYDDQPSGTINAFAIGTGSGLLTPVNHAASGGRNPCFICVGPDGKDVLVANYSAGTVALLPVLADGGVGEPARVIQHFGKGVHPTRQKQAYAHSINVSPDGRFAYAADLGNDTLYTYRVDSATATINPSSELTLPAGSGPRHLAFHPDNHHAYLINELANTITVLTRDPDKGTLAAIQTVSTLPEGYKDNNTAAEIVVHPSGRFVYGSNRGLNSIAVFAVDPATAKLTPVENISTRGKTPRNFAIDPTGHWLIAANQDSDNLVIFAIDQTTGQLTLTGQSAKVGSPVCIKFL